jgi:MFS family permease
VIIALPAIFRGIQLDPLDPSNVGYLLWILLGYMVVNAALVVTLGRLGDIYGRVKMYNLGFVVFTLASIALSLVYSTGPTAGMELIIGRVVQGIGGAMLIGNSAAILTDAFEPHERGMAMGINQVAAIGGQFIGLIAGGLLAEVSWHLVFLINVPIGVIGTIWAYLRLREISDRSPAKIDWWGNLSFAAALVMTLVGITYGIMPYGGHTMGWTSPIVVGMIIGGLAMGGLFVWVERRAEAPMFDLHLFRIRPFSAGNVAGLMYSMSRGGMQFMLIIWLQGIWLPLHGYNFVDTPLWAGIYLIPLTVGFLLAGPFSGRLSDRIGARSIATWGLLVAAAMFGLLMTLPPDFSYLGFAAMLFVLGIGFGAFSAPNQTSIMNSVPRNQRGAASGIAATFLFGGMVLSIGLFFSLMIAGLSTSLPPVMQAGLTSHGVPAAAAAKIASLPPVGSLFAAFLGYNPMETMLGGTLKHLTPQQAHALTGNDFFPHLISNPFMHGLILAFGLAIAMCIAGAVASAMRGERYIHTQEAPAPLETEAA